MKISTVSWSKLYLSWPGEILCVQRSSYSASRCCLFVAAAHPAEVTPVHDKLETDSSPSLLLCSLLMKTCTYHCAHWLMLVMSLSFQQRCSRSCPSMYSRPHSVVDKQVWDQPCVSLPWLSRPVCSTMWVHTTYLLQCVLENLSCCASNAFQMVFPDLNFH